MVDELLTTATITPIVQTNTTQNAGSRTDDMIWRDILKLMLDGTMMHISLFECFATKDIKGFACMHKHHAEEEFHCYLHVAGDYIDLYKKIADVSNVSQPSVKIDGTTKEDIMWKGMDIYETWEKRVYSSLKNYQEELIEGKEYVDHLLCNVNEEIKCINLIENDMIDGKYEELENFLTKKWGDH